MASCFQSGVSWQRTWGTVKVAYWDTAQGNPPRLVGEIRGTPTIKFIAPSKKNKRDSNKKKTVSAYNGERKFDAMRDYAEAMMPSYVTRIFGARDLEKFDAQATKYALPRFLLFQRTHEEHLQSRRLYRRNLGRRALVAEVKATKKNADIIKELGVDAWLADKGSDVKNVIVAAKDNGTYLCDEEGWEAREVQLCAREGIYEKVCALSSLLRRSCRSRKACRRKED